MATEIEKISRLQAKPLSFVSKRKKILCKENVNNLLSCINTRL